MSEAEVCAVGDDIYVIFTQEGEIARELESWECNASSILTIKLRDQEP